MPKKNKYVDFVSDAHFLDCVKWVCNAYSKETKATSETLHRNTVDPFKMVFDIINNQTAVKSWVKGEVIRQADKTINNRIGDFHQKLLGGVKGWKNLGTGDESKVDLKKSDNSVFIELKNKYNTVNADSKDKVRDKLENALKNNPNAKAYWAYILGKNGDSGERVWVYNQRADPRIMEVWGEKVYELVTGNQRALEKTWEALPYALTDALKTGFKMSSKEIGLLVEFFELAFRA